MKGKISKMWINSLGDGRTYATLQIGEDRYQLWDQEQIKSISQGDTIEYDFSKSGRYKNISKLTKVMASKKKPEEEHASIIPLYKGKLDRETIKSREIVRMSCLKSALYASSDLIDYEFDEKTDKIIEVAKKFEKYITDFGEMDKLVPKKKG